MGLELSALSASASLPLLTLQTRVPGIRAWHTPFACSPCGHQNFPVACCTTPSCRRSLRCTLRPSLARRLPPRFQRWWPGCSPPAPAELPGPLLLLFLLLGLLPLLLPLLMLPLLLLLPQRSAPLVVAKA